MPALDHTLEVRARPGNDPDAGPGPDPGPRTRSFTRGEEGTDRLHLVVRNRVQGVPALADDADDAVGADDADIRFARGREGPEDVAREERPREQQAAITPPAGDAHARQEDLEAPAPQALLDLGLALAPRPDGAPALVPRTGRDRLGRRAHGTTSSSSGACGGGTVLAAFSIPIASRRANTAVTPS